MELWRRDKEEYNRLQEKLFVNNSTSINLLGCELCYLVWEHHLEDREWVLRATCLTDKKALYFKGIIELWNEQNNPKKVRTVKIEKRDLDHLYGQNSLKRVKETIEDQYDVGILRDNEDE